MSYYGNVPNFGHLRIFESVAATGSTIGAAAAVNRSQPAVTLALGRLEAFAGAVLLERSRTGSHLTEAGAVFLARIKRFFDQVDDALLRPLVGLPMVRPEKVAAIRGKLSATSIRGLIAIAEHGTVQDAAVAAGISKPSLYRMSKDLERTLGRACFERGVSGLVANKSTAELARRFNVALREIDYAREEVAALQGRVFSDLKIAVRRTSDVGPLNEAVNEFLASFPGARVSIADGPFDLMLKDLRHGRIDLVYGLLSRPDWAIDIEEEPLFYDPYSIAMRSGHPLTRKSKVTVDDLASYDWIMPRPGPRRSVIEALFEGRELPKNAIETSSAEVQLAALASSDRITLIASRAARHYIVSGLLTTIDFPGVRSRAHDGIAVRRNWQPTSTQAHFIGLLRTHANSI